MHWMSRLPVVKLVVVRHEWTTSHRLWSVTQLVKSSERPRRSETPRISQDVLVFSQQASNAEVAAFERPRGITSAACILSGRHSAINRISSTGNPEKSEYYHSLPFLSNHLSMM